MTKRSSDTWVELDTKRWVRKSDYDKVLTAIKKFIPSMFPRHSYSVETMVGQAIWSSSLKWHAGPIVAHAVRRRELSLRFADNGRRATNTYELDSSPI